MHHYPPYPPRRKPPDPRAFHEKVQNVVGGPPAPPLQFRQYRIATWVWLGLAALVVIVVGVAIFSGRRPDATAFALIAVFSSSPFWIAGLVFLIGDWTFKPNVHDPLETMKTYIKAIKQRRWDVAFQLLAPVNQRMPTRFPPMQNAGLPPGAESIALQSPRDLKRFWSYARGNREGYQRRIAKFKALQVMRNDGRVALVQSELVMQATPLVALYLTIAAMLLITILAVFVLVAFQKNARIELYKTLVRDAGGRWYILHGDVYGPDDEMVRSGIYDYFMQHGQVPGFAQPPLPPVPPKGMGPPHPRHGFPHGGPLHAHGGPQHGGPGPY